MKALRLTARRLAILPLSLFFLGTAVFLLTESMPGDPAVTIAGSFASEESVAAIREELGLNDPAATRYVAFWRDLARGDLGDSLISGQPVLSEIATRLPNSLELVLTALLLSIVMGVAGGTAGAYFRHRLPDRLVGLYITFWQAVPVFVVGLGLIFFLYFVLRWLPAPVGRLGIGEALPPRVTGFLLIDSALTGSWTTFSSVVRHLIMPALSLAFVFSAYIAKTTHGAMIDALSSEQIEYARACGLTERRVVRYALLNSRTAILTYAAIIFAQVVGGSAVIEVIFAWQGIGQWGLEGVLSLDVPVIQGFVLASGIGALLVFLLLDLTVIALDPRVNIE